MKQKNGNERMSVVMLDYGCGCKIDPNHESVEFVGIIEPLVQCDKHDGRGSTAGAEYRQSAVRAYRQVYLKEGR